MGRMPELTLVGAEQFFHELLTSAAKNQKVDLRPETHVYLVGLLRHFINTENLYARDESGTFKDEPLAFLVREALEENSREGQALMFRHLGDFSLYVAGYFQESIQRKRVEVDYYIDMGCVAYKNVAQLTDESGLRSVCHEMALRFPALVGLLSEVSTRTTPAPKTEADVLRAYDLWFKTRSERAAKILKQAGIKPGPH